MEERPEGDRGSEYPNGPSALASVAMGKWYEQPSDADKRRAHRWVPGVVQLAPPEGVLDLGPGHLDPALLPVGLLQAAYHDAFAEYGSAALTYGNNQGPYPLRAALAGRLAHREQVACGPEHILVTAGTSSMLDLLARVRARPGDVVLTEATSYDLGCRIFQDRGLRLRGVPMDGAGMDPSALEAAVAGERAADRRIAFVYVIPTFHNPTGLLVPLERRLELLAVTRRCRTLVVEDDAYADLAFHPDGAVRSLASLAGFRGVVALRTFSKSLAPGLRLGWLLGDPRWLHRLAASAAFTSGGGLNHLAAVAVTGLLEHGAYERHVAWLRERLRARRDALVGTLRATLPAGFEVGCPNGGLFCWVRLPGGPSEAAFLAAAERAGVPVAAGARFGRSTGSAVRLCFGFYDPPRLVEAAERLSAAWRRTAGAPAALQRGFSGG
jgi:2-aminoadipate transaminase